MKGAYRKGAKKYKRNKKYKKKLKKDYITKVRYNGLKRMPGFDPYSDLPT